MDQNTLELVHLRKKTTLMAISSETITKVTLKVKEVAVRLSLIFDKSKELMII